jgi:uncharacterized protein YjbJ (UPF0337 family)
LDKDKIEGNVKDAAGRAERQAGEWTGDEEAQAKGAMRQAEGKAQAGLGKLKQMGRESKNHMDRERHRSKDDEDKAA